MPSWNIHLAIAKKINKELNLDKNSFYLGNLIADIDYNCKLSRIQTHYDNYVCNSCPTKLLPNIEEFLHDYKEVIKNNSLILGYYSHLLADYYYNNVVFSKCWIQNENNEIIGIKLKNGIIMKNNKEDFSLRKKYKHHDFDLYGKYLFNENLVEIPEYDNNISINLKCLKNNFCTDDDIKRRIDYLKGDFLKVNKYSWKEKIFGLDYKLFSKKELDVLFEECCNFIIEKLTLEL